jgi:hypothetical protein
LRNLIATVPAASAVSLERQRQWKLVILTGVEMGSHLSNSGGLSRPLAKLKNSERNQNLRNPTAHSKGLALRVKELPISSAASGE